MPVAHDQREAACEQEQQQAAGIDRGGACHIQHAAERRAAVRTALRRVSGVDAVCAEIDRAAAPVRYRRIEAVLTELTGMAAGPGGARLAEFLAGDDVVLARMAAAAEVLGAAGMPVSRAADSLRMAVGWQRYAEGPVSELHRSCGLDLTRGALRLWDRREPKR